MSGARVIKLDETDVISYGPLSHFRPILGDDAGTTPVCMGLQACQPGYEVPLHCHPYVEVLYIVDGVVEFWLEGEEDKTMVLCKGDSIELHPGVWHAFRVLGNDVARLLGVHASPKRVVQYKPGVRTDARGFRIYDE